MEYIGSNKAKYTLENTPFKKGGEGSVYNIVGKPDCVAKIYHGNVITAELESKIKYITNNPPSKTILDQIAWPLDYLRNANGQFVGFVMPKLKIDAELGELYKYPPKKIKLTNEQKLVVAINICRVISEVHKAGYVFGDFNPCNIGVNLTTGNVAFLDTDSYHIYDKNTQHTYRCSVCLPGYVAPELIKRCKGTDFKSAPLPTFTQESDRFALAIHIFKLLFNGYTPFNGIPENITSSQASPGQGNEAIEKDNYCFKPGNKPMSASVPPMDSFPPEICDLFSRAFIVGRYNATLRPTAEEWDKALCDYRNNLVVCAKNPLHSYYKDLQDCPYCQAELNYNLTLSGKKVYGNTSSGSVSQLNFSNPVAVPVSSMSSNKTSSRGSSGVSSKASTTLTGAINQGKNNQKQTGFRKKFKRFVIAMLCILIVGSGVAGGLYYKNGIDNANATAELIEYLPNEIYDYEHYDDLINDAYSAYLNLADWQKDKVSNKDKLLAIVPAYNEYKVGNLRTEMQKVTVDSVKTTTALADTVNLYNALKPDQKTLLIGDEIHTLDNYVKVNNVIKGLNDINDDLVNRYGEVKDVQKIYYSIDPQFTNLVYNYGLVEEFDDKLAFLNLFAFEQNEVGTYSIKVKDPTSLSGKVELPAKYDGQDVVSIPEGAFENCKNVTSFVVPDTITEIGKGAFKGCSRLEEMSLPFTGRSEGARVYEAVFGFVFGYTDVESSGQKGDKGEDFVDKTTGNVDGAIWQYSCYNGDSYWGGYLLKSYYYNIPSSLRKVTITKQTEVKTAAFNGCKNITEVKYTQGLTGIGVASFLNCENLELFNSDKKGTVDLSGDYLAINTHAFKNCLSIKEVKIPSGVVTVADYCFENMPITKIVIPETVESIGRGAFYGCNKLEEITLPFTGNREAASGYNAVLGFIFHYTEVESSGQKGDKGTSFQNKTTGDVDGAIWQYSCYNGDSYWGGYLLKSYYYHIPSSLKKVTITKQTEVKTAAFNGCNMLTSITFTQGIQKQGECAFQNCTATVIG